MTECNNPQCPRPASDDDKYQDGFGNVYCGVPCLMTSGKYPKVDCPECGGPTSDHELEMFDGECGSCLQAKFDEAGHSFDPDYEVENA